MKILSPQNFKTVVNTSIATPSAGEVVLFADTDNKLKQKDSTGTLTDLTATGGGGGGSITKNIVQVDFGISTQNEDIAKITISDTNITATSYPSVSMYATSTSDHDPYDYMAEGLIPYVANIVAGVGFDIFVRAPNMTWGKYNVVYHY